jgi:hypothetical protein
MNNDRVIAIVFLYEPDNINYIIGIILAFVSSSRNGLESRSEYVLTSRRRLFEHLT